MEKLGAAQRGFRDIPHLRECGREINSNSSKGLKNWLLAAIVKIFLFQHTRTRLDLF